MITQNKSIQHFAVSGTATVEFMRFTTNVVISVPAGSTATVDFDGCAAAASVAPLALPAGVHQFVIPVGKINFVVSAGTVTGVGISL